MNSKQVPAHKRNRAVWVIANGVRSREGRPKMFSERVKNACLARPERTIDSMCFTMQLSRIASDCLKSEHANCRNAAMPCYVSVIEAGLNGRRRGYHGTGCAPTRR